MNAARRLVLIALLATGGCAVEPSRLDGPRVVTGVEIAPFGIHEECIALEPREEIFYRFQSTAPVSFNIQFRDGNAVILPLTRDAVTEDSGPFVADRKQIYCLMWEAGAQASVVDYRVSPRGPRQ